MLSAKNQACQTEHVSYFSIWYISVKINVNHAWLPRGEVFAELAIECLHDATEHDQSVNATKSLTKRHIHFGLAWNCSHKLLQRYTVIRWIMQTNTYPYISPSLWLHAVRLYWKPTCWIMYNVGLCGFYFSVYWIREFINQCRMFARYFEFRFVANLRLWILWLHGY
jgi:hypothetical protein